MIRLITGKPGSGKSTYAIVLAKELKDQGRAVYVHGIKDFDFEKFGAKHTDDPIKWQDLPDGSVVVIDECYSTFPNRNPGAKVPDHVDAMARHRHRGFDFILMAQQGLQLDPFLRGLYDSHEHLIKKFGKKTRIKRWDTYEGNAAKAASSDAHTWLRPSWPHQFFTSTVVDTSKLHVPMWVKLLAIAIFIVGGLAWFLKHRATAQIERARTEQESAAATASRSGATAAAGDAAREAGHYDTPQDFIRAQRPRIITMPGSAPIYDGRTAQSHPTLACMSSSPGRDADGSQRGAGCHCMTEQGTRYDLPEDKCRYIARNGPAYDPFKAPVAVAAIQPQQPQASAESASMAAPAAAVSGGSGQPFGSQATYGELGVR